MTRTNDQDQRPRPTTNDQRPYAWHAAAGVLLFLGLVAAAWWVVRAPLREGSQPPIELRRSTEPLTLAATGDSVIGRDLPAAGLDPGFDGVVKILHASSLAVTDLEQTLAEEAPTPTRNQTARWPVGTVRTAADLRRLGFTIAARANDHAGDEGEDGLARTAGLLAQAGLAYAGAGDDLSLARRAVVIGTAPRRVALVAVSTSVLPEHRATASRGEIHGRAGVAALKYTADITADPATYLALTQVAAVSGQTPSPGGELQLSGTVIRRGERTKVDFRADTRDVEDILAEITRARAAADIVVVSLHSHEPENRNDAPADFVRDFARQAIDAGAGLIIGHGPRQLRGIEVYRGAAILYSLGNFVFDYSVIGRDAANVFDTTMNFYERALSSRIEGTGYRLADYDEPFWWQSVIATAAFDNGALKSLSLTPITLGEELPKAERGFPRLATPAQAEAILQRLTALSAPFGTRISVKDGVGTVLTFPR
jgi:poly-gamma-glutamate capsule biosynthesis protein CapA/YwtB (metallophosphatase superfamily)